ncbi:MAG: hypothetical protein R3F11_19065 [Verrucomicrobiales bacterium]
MRPAGAGSYTTLSPRQPVTPTPAALYATATSDLGVIAAKAVNLPNTNVPAHGTAGVSGSALYVRTAPSGSAVGRGGIVHHQDSNFAIRETATNTGTADGARLEYDAVSRANPESVAKEDILVLRGDGNVGIGTNSPAATLDVRGDIRSNNNPIYFRTSGDNYHGSPTKMLFRMILVLTIPAASTDRSCGGMTAGRWAASTKAGTASPSAGKTMGASKFHPTTSTSKTAGF